MIEILKNLLGKKKEEKRYVPDPPGRTFKRVPSGKYFGSENPNADESSIRKAKQRKIDQITELGLLPMYTRYTYKNKRGHGSDFEVSSAHVVFQKEVSVQTWNMVHITEISFIVLCDDFDEFEKLADVNLKSDFRNLTEEEKTSPYSGEERRKRSRKTGVSGD